MARTLVIRTVYIRVTDAEGKRKYVNIGRINRKGEFRWTNTRLLDSKGMPLPGIFEVGMQ